MLKQEEVINMKYKKIPIKGYKDLYMYPVYVEDVFKGQEPLKVVGITENQVLLQGNLYPGTNYTQKEWFDEDEVFVVKTVCEEQLKPNGCQVHNIHCCGGGSVLDRHVDYFWENLID